MKVYKVETDINFVQWVMPQKEFNVELFTLSLESNSKLKVWKDYEFYVFNPKTKRTNFFKSSYLGGIVCDEIAAKKMSFFFNLGVELLPITIEDYPSEKFYILNVIDCVNALDKKNTVFEYFDKEKTKKGTILKYAFHDDRFTESTLFKIPETDVVDILTAADFRAKEDEFYYAYMNSNLTGLKFIEIFDSNNP